MQKFTAFTVILTVLILVVVSEVVVNEYLPALDQQVAVGDNMGLTLPDDVDLSQTIATNVLGSDLGTTDYSDYLGAEPSNETVTIDFGDDKKIDRGLEDDSFVEEEPVLVDEPVSNATGDFEDVSVTAQASYSPNVYLREEQVRSAGFANAYLEEEKSDDLLYKTIQLNDIEGLEVLKTMVRTEQDVLAKVYVLKPGINMEVSDLYNLLKGRAAQGLNSEVNETNQFGQNSFYMNDSARPGTAFLTVRIGGLIYSFSYPKDYHSQIKNLVQLIMWELS